MIVDAFQTFLVNLGNVPPAAEGAAPPLEGFDPGRLADPTDPDPQYRFGRVVRGVALDQVRTIGDAERLLACLRPAVLRPGLPVRRIDGDRILIVVRGQLLWVDVIRGVGSQAPVWQWAVRDLNLAA